MIIHLDNTIEGYRNFIRIKQLPRYEIRGRLAVIPDEYAGLMGHAEPGAAAVTFKPKAWLFDYQKAIVATAVKKRKFAIFADCGLGKTPMLLEFARHVHKAIPNKPVLIVSPLMVVPQTIGVAGGSTAASSSRSITRRLSRISARRGRWPRRTVRRYLMRWVWVEWDWKSQRKDDGDENTYGYLA